MTNQSTTTPALVFGANSIQGRAVVEGLVDAGCYKPVYAFTRETDGEILHYLTDGLGATNIIHGDLQNPDHVKNALTSTKATAIFLVTATELPNEIGQTTGYNDAAEDEFQTIVLFFQLLVQAYEQDKISRHVIFSVRDNVQASTLQLLKETNEIWISPLQDGSIVPHFTAKGKGGEYGMEYIKKYSNELKLTLLTIPFLYSNFLGFFCPLPDETQTQWMLTACFGDGSNKIDMMGSQDLAKIVPNVLASPDEYNRKNLRLVGEQISMDEIAAVFSDLFGKDVIYNPLSVEEVSELPAPWAPCMAQMCQFLGDPRCLRHDIEITKKVCFPKRPQTFEDWLLTHSSSTAFQKVGLDLDAPEILSIVVFDATKPEGVAVVAGLLNDTRKQYQIRAAVPNIESKEAKALKEMDPDRIELINFDFDDLISCQKAAEGVDGAFLKTDFYEAAGKDMDVEEQHAKNVIDACEASTTVRHLVFSTMESYEELKNILDLGLTTAMATKNYGGNNPFDAKARAAAYARTKKISVTYVLMPCYTEMFFDMIEKRTIDGQERLVLTIPIKDDKKVMCMSVDDLGPAVANIFDSYQVYAGHEVGLVTDFVSASDVRDIIEEVFLQDEDNDIVMETEEVTKEDWVQAKDTYMKDLGQMFTYMTHSDAVKLRRSIAKTMKLVPSAKPLRQWVEDNVDNLAFREKLGLR